MAFSLKPRWSVGVSSGGIHLGARQPVVVCSGRHMARGPILRGRKLGREAILTIQNLKRVRSERPELERVLKTQVSRLLKVDMLQVLAELQRQNECSLAYEVFKLVRQETWYKPDSMLYCEMMDLLGQNARISDVEKLFEELQSEMLPDSRIYTELMHAYLRCQKSQDAVDTFEEMKQLGLEPGARTYLTLIKGLQKKGLADKADAVRAELDEVHPRQSPDLPEETEVSEAEMPTS